MNLAHAKMWSDLRKPNITKKEAFYKLADFFIICNYLPIALLYPNALYWNFMNEVPSDWNSHTQSIFLHGFSLCLWWCKVAERKKPYPAVYFRFMVNTMAHILSLYINAFVIYKVLVSACNLLSHINWPFCFCYFSEL